MAKESGKTQAVTKAESPQIAPDMIATFARLASDPNTDVVKLNALIDIYWKVEGKRAETAFNAAMAAAQAELAPVAKKSWNPHTKSRYAALDAVYEAIKPIIAKHGFGSSYGTAPSQLPNHVQIYCDVTHSGGHSKRYTSDIPTDDVGMKGNVNKTPIQAFGSTTSYARRYMTLLIFDVATGDDNDGNATDLPGTINATQVKELEDLLTETNQNKAKFLEYAKAETLEDILAKNFETAKLAIKERAKALATAAGAKRNA